MEGHRLRRRSRFDGQVGAVLSLVHEVRPGALSQPAVRSYIDRLSEHLIVFHIRQDSMRRLLGGPADQVRAVMETARQYGELTIDGKAVDPDVPIDRVLAAARRTARS